MAVGRQSMQKKVCKKSNPTPGLDIIYRNNTLVNNSPLAEWSDSCRRKPTYGNKHGCHAGPQCYVQM